MNNKLTQPQQIIINSIKSFVAQELAHDFSGHDMAHIERVVSLCNYILASEPKANAFIVLLSAYLHDVIDEKVMTDVDQARKTLHKKLEKENISPKDQLAIFDIIDNMSYRKNLTKKQTLSLEGKIVQDADRLDAIGAIGIGRTFYYGGNKQNIMHDPMISQRSLLDENSYRTPNTVINHFYEKLLRLKDEMNTNTAKELANKRHQFLVQFVEQFENEWLGKFND